MTDVHLIGIDIAKRVFQAHAINQTGETLWTKKLSRPQFEWLCSFWLWVSKSFIDRPQNYEQCGRGEHR